MDVQVGAPDSNNPKPTLSFLACPPHCTFLHRSAASRIFLPDAVRYMVRGPLQERSHQRAPHAAVAAGTTACRISGPITKDKQHPMLRR